jgi:hypothetical protein
MVISSEVVDTELNFCDKGKRLWLKEKGSVSKNWLCYKISFCRIGFSKINFHEKFPYKLLKITI